MEDFFCAGCTGIVRILILFLFWLKFFETDSRKRKEIVSIHVHIEWLIYLENKTKISFLLFSHFIKLK